MGKRGAQLLLKFLTSATAAQNANERTLVLMSLEEIKVYLTF